MPLASSVPRRIPLNCIAAPPASWPRRDAALTRYDGARPTDSSPRPMSRHSPHRRTGDERIQGDRPMTKIVAVITTSIDGYITGPNDGPDAGLGEGGERLHYWVFGGPWRYDDERHGEAT